MNVQAALALAVIAATPLVFGALGELLYEKVGLFNAGIEGVMLIGAAVAFMVAVDSGSITLGLATALGAGALFTLVVYAIPVLYMRASQILVSFAVWFVGAGLSAQIARSYTNRSVEARLERTEIPVLSDIPYLGSILFNQYWPVYLGIGLVLLVGWMLVRTRHGLSMRSIGEDPASAHAAGIQVRSWQLFYIAVGGALMGAAGGILSVIVTGTWQEQMTGGRGFVAFALVIFAGWRPIGLLWGAYLFGLLLVLGDVGQANGWGIPAPVLSMLPYLFTIIVLALRSWRELRRRTTLAPAALGAVFIRGQR